jgi:DNA-binding LytR/AlgR family response regulator
MEHNVAKNPHLQINEKSKLTCPIAHIIRLEAVGNYCKIITKDQSYFIPKTLKRFALVCMVSIWSMLTSSVVIMISLFT